MFVHGDLTKAEQVYALFDNHEPRTVYRLGALLSAGAETNPTMGTTSTCSARGMSSKPLDS